MILTHRLAANLEICCLNSHSRLKMTERNKLYWKEEPTTIGVFETSEDEEMVYKPMIMFNFQLLGYEKGF